MAASLPLSASISCLLLTRFLSQALNLSWCLSAPFSPSFPASLSLSHLQSGDGLAHLGARARPVTEAQVIAEWRRETWKFMTLKMTERESVCVSVGEGERRGVGREREGVLALSQTHTHAHMHTPALPLPPTLQRGEDMGERAASPETDRQTDRQTVGRGRTGKAKGRRGKKREGDQETARLRTSWGETTRVSGCGACFSLAWSPLQKLASEGVTMAYGSKESGVQAGDYLGLRLRKGQNVLQQVSLLLARLFPPLGCWGKGSQEVDGLALVNTHNISSPWTMGGRRTARMTCPQGLPRSSG